MTITRIDYTLDTLWTDVHNDTDSETDALAMFLFSLMRCQVTMKDQSDAIDSY